MFTLVTFTELNLWNYTTAFDPITNIEGRKHIKNYPYLYLAQQLCNIKRFPIDI